MVNRNKTNAVAYFILCAAFCCCCLDLRLGNCLEFFFSLSWNEEIWNREIYIRKWVQITASADFALTSKDLQQYIFHNCLSAITANSASYKKRIFSVWKMHKKLLAKTILYYFQQYIIKEVAFYYTQRAKQQKAKQNTKQKRFSFALREI